MTPPTPEAEEAAVTTLIQACAAYAALKGWTVVVAGPVRIQQWPGWPAYNYELVLPFTGTRPGQLEPTPDPKAGG